MSRNGRLGLLAAGIVVLVVAFVALRPKDAETPTRTDAATAATNPEASAAPSATTGSTGATPTASAQPVTPLLHSGTVRTITVTKGDTVRLRARSTSDDEVHVHGYDLMKDAPAGQTVSLSFKADIDGIFEVEFEDAGEQIAKLVVEP